MTRLYEFPGTQRPAATAGDLGPTKNIVKEILVYRPHEIINLVKKKLANKICCLFKRAKRIVDDTYEGRLVSVKGAL